MQSQMARMGVNGRFVVPAQIRQALGLRSGEKLEVSLDEDGIHLRTQRQMIARSQAIMRKYASAGRCISDELIAERRLEAKREEEEFG
jgi:AbrB family looped-hinge helix DNA binding protein